MAFDIYAEVTERIIEQMEGGVIPWEKPWIMAGRASSNHPEAIADPRVCAVSRITGKAYSLLNQMLLGRPGEYITFKQCLDLGGKVKKGEKSSMVVFWKMHEVTETDPNTNTTIKKNIPMLRYYNVFHIDQCENIKPRKPREAKPEPTTPEPKAAFTPDEAADNVISEYIRKSGVILDHMRGDRAYYQPGIDRVVLPMIDQFKHRAEYYSTAFHELTHSTGHKSRLDRLANNAFFGNEEYSKEELVAEIGAAALVNHCGLETASSFRNSTAYIQSWLKVLKEDKRFIVSASSRAEKAVELILA